MLSSTVRATGEIDFDPMQTNLGLQQSLDFFAIFDKTNYKATVTGTPWDYDAQARGGYGDFETLKTRKIGSTTSRNTCLGFRRR